MLYNYQHYNLLKKEYDIINQYFNLGDYNADNYKASIASVANFIKDFPDSKYIDEMMFISINSYYLLALNSLESKKQERLNLAMESYLKLLDLYPKSIFLQKAESVYVNCNKEKSKQPK